MQIRKQKAFVGKTKDETEGEAKKWMAASKKGNIVYSAPVLRPPLPHRLLQQSKWEVEVEYWDEVENVQPSPSL